MVLEMLHKLPRIFCVPVDVREVTLLKCSPKGPAKNLKPGAGASVLVTLLLYVKRFSTPWLLMLPGQDALMWVPETSHSEGLTSVSCDRLGWLLSFHSLCELCCENSF